MFVSSLFLVAIIFFVVTFDSKLPRSTFMPVSLSVYSSLQSVGIRMLMMVNLVLHLV